MKGVVLFLLLFILAAPITFGAGINNSEAVEIGGIKQWIKFQGVDDQAPVLLFLHGGPGNSVISYADRFTKELQKHFIVVLWDQRESGQTAVLNKSPDALSVSIFVSDAIEVIKFLCARFRQEKIYLVGHSWGGYLGLRVVAERPELLKGYFAVSPMINQLESERLSLKVLQEKAAKENNQKELSELSQVEVPFKNGVQLYYHRKWLSKLMNSTTPIREKVDQWSVTWLTLFNEASQTNFFEFAPALKCPVYFLIGSNDYQTHFKLAESYYQQVVCQEKKLSWFKHSAHNPHLTETAKFEELLIEIKNQKLKSEL
ncbi:MAG: alpha/beta hydrolase [Cyclobacteriaceae bacterium]